MVPFGACDCPSWWDHSANLGFHVASTMDEIRAFFRGLIN